MENLRLCADDVGEYVQQQELPRRRQGRLGSFADEIIRYGGFVGSAVECHPTLPRAMQRARHHIDASEQAGRAVASGRLILADTLSASKGRFTRSWHAPPGGLWGCLLHANTLNPQSALLLSIAAGVAACEAIHETGADRAAIRWVNDVLIDGAKVAGFLIESHTGPRWGEQFHLLGFGINVNNQAFPDELRDTATSLAQHLQEQIDLSLFGLRFIAKLIWNIGLLYFVEARQGNWYDEQPRFIHPVMERWLEISDTVGKKVMFGYDVMTSPQYAATVTGISRDGGLQMLLEDGLTITEHSGEVRYI